MRCASFCAAFFIFGLICGVAVEPRRSAVPPSSLPFRPNGLQLSCTARDRAEYLEACRQRLRGVALPLEPRNEKPGVDNHG